jgi:regulatory protein YycI of two-component signal transduction system YycFG
MLADIKKLDNPVSLISAADAVSVLYSQDRLASNSEIVRTELGYYTQYPLPTFRNLAPAWRIEIKHTETGGNEIYEEFMVHAIDGEIIKSDQQQRNKMME